MAITTGAIILPSNSPNFTQTTFKGLSSFESIKPRSKKSIAIGMGHILNDPPCIKGQIDISAKTIKKSNYQNS